jgi:hypothetical protein
MESKNFLVLVVILLSLGIGAAIVIKQHKNYEPSQNGVTNWAWEDDWGVEPNRPNPPSEPPSKPEREPEVRPREREPEVRPSPRPPSPPKQPDRPRFPWRRRRDNP